MNNVQKPLQGIKVLAFAFNLPGPVAAAELQKLGASVTRVESPAGDTFATWCPSWYKALCSGQRVLRIDLKTAEGLAAMEGLLAESDLFLTSFRLSALQRLSLDRGSVEARHPALCQVAIVGYPAPLQNQAGHDITYQAALGLVTPPHNPRTFVADLSGAQRAAIAAVSLLYARERGLGAGYAEISLSESAEEFAEPLRHGITSPGSLFGGGLPEYGLYESREGWIAVAALEKHFRDDLGTSLGINGEISREKLQVIFLTRTAREWEEWATANDLPIAAVR